MTAFENLPITSNQWWRFFRDSKNYWILESRVLGKVWKNWGESQLKLNGDDHWFYYFFLLVLKALFWWFELLPVRLLPFCQTYHASVLFIYSCVKETSLQSNGFLKTKQAWDAKINDSSQEYIFDDSDLWLNKAKASGRNISRWTVPAINETHPRSDIHIFFQI